MPHELCHFARTNVLCEYTMPLQIFILLALNFIIHLGVLGLGYKLTFSVQAVFFIFSLSVDIIFLLLQHSLVL